MAGVRPPPKKHLLYPSLRGKRVGPIINMFSKKRIIWTIVCVVVVSSVIWIVPNVIKYRKSVNASGTLTYQAGWTNSIIIPCVTTGSPPVCTSSNTTNPESVVCCGLKTVAQCPLYSYVSGVQSGGMGSGALFPNTSITEAGLVAGASVISKRQEPLSKQSTCFYSLKKTTVIIKCLRLSVKNVFYCVSFCRVRV